MRKAAAFLFMGLIGAGLNGCRHKTQAPMAVEVGVVTVHPQAVTLTTELPGRVSALRIAEVRPQVNGIVLKRLFKEGSVVAAGQALFQIDPATYDAAAESAEASVQKSSATLLSASALLQRYQPLVEANAVSKQDYDNAVAAAQSARADLAAAKAALESARINQIYSRVLAPISGRIGRSLVTEGALVTANQTAPLATIQQLDSVYVDAEQPSTMLLRLRRAYADGRLISGGKNRAAVRLTLEDGTPYASTGTLAVSEVTVDPGSGAVTLRSIFPNPDQLLLPGMFVHELIQEGVNPHAMLVPQQGVVRDQRGEPNAYIAGKDDKVELRTLKTDRTIGTQWLVSEGLEPGDRVIIEGLQKIAPGALVHAVEVPQTPANAAPAAPSASETTAPSAH